MSEQRENTYFTDPQSVTEMTRLYEQDKGFTLAQGGLLPEIDTSTVHDLLDLACGSGKWALDVASQYPHIQVAGIDISETMITYARTQAQARKLLNIYFRLVSILPPSQESLTPSIATFPDSAYDLINERMISTAVKETLWPWLLSQCYRLLRKNGILRMTECNGYLYKDAPNMCAWNELFIEAMSNYGHLPPNTRMFQKFRHMLHNAHFSITQEQPLDVNFSPGSPAHRTLVQTSLVAIDETFPFIEAHTQKNPRSLEKILAGARRELHGQHEMHWYGKTLIARKQ